MPSSERNILIKTLMLFDLLAMVLSFAMATIVAHHQINTVSFQEFLAMRVTVQNFALFLGLLLGWHFIFVLMGVYRSSRLTSQRRRIIDEIKATFSGSLVLFAIAVLFKIVLVTPIFLAVFLTASSAIIILSRVILGYVLKLLRINGRNLRHILIVGTNLQAVQFAQKIEKNKELGYRLIGFVDNNLSGLSTISGRV